MKTTATIVNVSRSTSTNFSHHTQTTTTRYTDVVDFTTPAGKQYQESVSGSGNDHIGGTVAVIYDPSDPSDVEQATLSGLWWITPVALLLFALVFSWLGTRVLRIRPRATLNEVTAIGGF